MDAMCALFKVKFDPDKIDTMIVQAVSLLDDIDKELNNYVMRSVESECRKNCVVRTGWCALRMP